MRVRRLGWMLALVATAVAAAQQSSVVDSPHNLSTFGPGAVRAVSEEQVCIFCHAPHNASPVRPLWNRAMPTDAYAIYTSRALDAEPGQPTGSSKMCLSCHDGTIALGSVFSSNSPIAIAGGVTTIPPGAAHLGTDLRDDHPISFRFDSLLAADDPKLKAPSMLPHEIMLDENGELQCTTCHDAHNNVFGDFLVLDPGGSQLCLACHQMGTTTLPAHDSCNACHRPHRAPSGPYLLTHATVAETCLSCHDGTHAGAADIKTDLNKLSSHETFSQVDPPEPLASHASCADCHDPHTMTSVAAVAPGMPGALGRSDGLSSSGSPLTVASNEFEVCYKCHADGSRQQPWIARVIAQNNTRLEFSVGAISSHPIEIAGRSNDVPSLLPGWTADSFVRCSDCHASDTAGFGSAGVHGSNYQPLLTANYTTIDYTTESARAYALCYKCHDRNSILNDESFSGHRKHIVDERTPCSACHDAHGIDSIQGSNTGNTHLINFATRIVFPDPGTGRLEFQDTGFNSGACLLRCHGKTHSPESYPDD